MRAGMGAIGAVGGGRRGVVGRVLGRRARDARRKIESGHRRAAVLDPLILTGVGAYAGGVQPSKERQQGGQAPPDPIPEPDVEADGGRPFLRLVRTPGQLPKKEVRLAERICQVTVGGGLEREKRGGSRGGIEEKDGDDDARGHRIGVAAGEGSGGEEREQEKLSPLTSLETMPRATMRGLAGLAA